MSTPIGREIEAERARAAVEVRLARIRVERALFPDEPPLTEARPPKRGASGEG